MDTMEDDELFGLREDELSRNNEPGTTADVARFPFDLRINSRWPQEAELANIRHMHFGLVLPKLRALLANTEYSQEIGTTSLHPISRSYSQVYSKLLSVSLANGFADLDDFPVAAIFYYLQTRFATRPIKKFWESLEEVESKCFAESLLKCAIAAGQPYVLDFLLSQNKFGFDVNRNLIVDQMRRLTLLEYAAGYPNVAVVKVLLKHRADVSKTFTDKGAFSRLIHWQKSLQDTHDQAFLEIGRLLIHADAQVDCCALISLLRGTVTGPKAKLIELVIHHGAAKWHRDWMRQGALWAAISQIHHEGAMAVAQTLVNLGADLNSREHSQFDEAMGFRQLIDAAAQKGDVMLVKMLHDNGAVYTNQTFKYAIESSSWSLIRHLIDEGTIPVRADEISFDLLEAVHTRGSELVSLLQKNPNTAYACERELFGATLYACCERGDLVVLRNLLNSPVLDLLDLKTNADKERSALLGRAFTKAIQAEKDEVALFLLDSGANVNSHDHDEVPAIIQALQKRKTELINAIIGANANIQKECMGSKVLPLQLAAEWGNLDIVINLIHAGADLDVTGRDESSKTLNLSPLCIAIARKDMMTANILLKAGANPNWSHCRDSYSPLATAVKSNDWQMVQLLLDYGADPSDTAAILESLNWENGILDLLICKFDQMYPSGKKKLGGLAIIKAIQQGNFDKLKRLLEALRRNADIETLFTTSTYGRKLSALAVAIGTENSVRSAVTQLLLESGANLTAAVSSEVLSSEPSNITERTALHHAIASKDLQMVSQLLDFGANVNQQAWGKIRRTPLQWAAEQGHFDVAVFLWRRGAKVNDVPAHSGGGTALQLASIGGYTGIVEFLLNNGADPNVRGAKINGRTALEGAAEHGRLKALELLLLHGARLDPDGRGYKCSEIRLAERNGHLALAGLLRSHLAEMHCLQNNERSGINHQSTYQGSRKAKTTAELTLLESCNFSEQLSDWEARQQKDTRMKNQGKRGCDHCQEVLSCSSALSRHKQSKHSDMFKYNCHICSRTFKRRDILQRHFDRHTESGKILCQGCGKHFCRKDYVNGAHLAFSVQCQTALKSSDR